MKVEIKDAKIEPRNQRLRGDFKNKEKKWEEEKKSLTKRVAQLERKMEHEENNIVITGWRWRRTL
jgi:hypothetical protein